MSAVYQHDDMSALTSAHSTAVGSWFAANVGKSIEDCVTALSLPYEVVWQCIQVLGLEVYPNASGELQFLSEPRGGHRRP
jgi:hypothetical protein